MSGLALAVFGLLPIVSLPLPELLRLLLAVAWLAGSGLELALVVAAFGRVTGYRVDETLALETRAPDGQWRPATLAAGTLVLSRAVWLRYCDSAGRCRGELFTGDARVDAGFRRLVVLLELGQEARNH